MQKKSPATKPTYQELEQRIKELEHQINLRSGHSELLPESQPVYAELIENALDGVVVLQGENIIYVNDAITKITGYSRNELAGKDFTKLNIVPAEDLGWVEKRYEEHYTDKDRSTIDEYAIICKDGTKKYIESLGNIIDYQGQPAIMSFIRDITQRKKIEISLIKSESFLYNIIEQNPHPIFIYDESGLLQRSNKAGRELWGFDDEFIGKYNVLEDNVLTEQGVMHHIENVYKEGDPAHFFINYDSAKLKNSGLKKHKKLILDVTLAPIKDIKGKTINVINIQRDVTKQKHAEESLDIQQQLAIDLSAVADIDEALNIVVDAALKIDGIDAGGIYFRNIENSELKLMYAKNLSDEFRDKKKHFKSNSQNANAVKQGKSIYLSLANKKGPQYSYYIKEGIQSGATIPILHGGNVIASLNAASKDLEEIPYLAQSLLESIGSQVGGVIARLRAEKALKKSEERFKNLYNNAQVGLFRTRISDGKVLEANELCAKLAGFDDLEEFINEWVVSEHYADPKARDEMLRQIMETGEVKNFEALGIRRDGREMWLSYSAKAYPEEGYLEGAFYDITARKTAEALSKKSEERYRRLFKNSPTGIVLCRIDGTIIEANPSICDLLGYKEKELLNKNFTEISHPEDIDKERPYYIKCLKGELDYYKIEKRFMKKNGEQIWTLLSVIVTHNDLKEPNMAYALIEDITPQKKYIEKITDALAFNEKIISQSPIGMSVYNEDGKCITANRAMAKIIGASLEGVLSQNFHNISSWKESGLYEAALSALKEKTSKYIEFDSVSTFGKQTTMECHFIPFMTEGTERLLLMANDRTERKKAREELRLKEFAISSSINGIAFTDLGGQITYVNDSLLKMWQYPEDEIVGRNVKDFFQDSDLIPQILEALKTKGHWVGELVSIKKDGSLNDVLLSSTLVVDEKGNPLSIMGSVLDVSERIKTEKSLRESEYKFAKAFRSSASMMAISTLDDGQFIEVNDQFLKVFGYETQEVVGKTVFDIKLFADMKQRNTIAEIARKNGFIHNYEVVFRTKKGKLLYCLFSAHVIHLEGKICWLTAANDITDRIQMETFMHAQHDLSIALAGVTEIKEAMTKVINAATAHKGFDKGGIYLKDPETGAFKLEFAKNLSNEFISEASHFDNVSTQAKYMNRWEPSYFVQDQIDETARNEGITAVAIIPILHLGEVIACMNIVSATFDEIPKTAKNFLESIGSQVGGAISRLRAEEELRREKENVQHYINVAGVMLLVIDRDQNIKLINPKGCEILGYSEEEIVGENWFDRFIPNELSEKTKHLFNKIINDEAEADNFYENTILTKSGNERIIAWHNTVLRDDKGSITGTLSSGEDITDRKIAEEQVKNHNIILQEAVKRTERDMEQLMEMHLRIEKLAAIGQIYGNIAHEIRNPLGSIKQSIFFLKRKMKTFPEKIQEHLELIDKELIKTNEVITNMLNTIDANHANRELIDLYRIVTEAIQRTRLDDRIKLKINIKEGKYFIKADPLQIQQVFINLLTNSIQSISDNGEIIISAKNMLHEDTCHIKIRDNGSGIDKKIQGKIFNPLFTTKSSGTGLGLGICKQIIESHGGEINVQSKKNKGTTVLIDLPLADDSE